MTIDTLIIILDQDIRARSATYRTNMNPRSIGYMEDDERLVFIAERDCERKHLHQLQQILDHLLTIDSK